MRVIFDRVEGARKAISLLLIQRSRLRRVGRERQADPELAKELAFLDQECTAALRALGYVEAVQIRPREQAKVMTAGDAK